MNKQQRAIAATLEYLREADIVLTEEEQQHIEIATFGLADYPVSGLQLLTYVNSPRYCAKELVLFPGQTCPEHLHPPFAGTPGKQETFRCRWGEVFLFVDDENLTLNDAGGEPVCRVPEGAEPLVHLQSLYSLVAWRTIHHRPQYPALVSGGKAGSGGVRVLFREP